MKEPKMNLNTNATKAIEAYQEYVRTVTPVVIALSGPFAPVVTAQIEANAKLVEESLRWFGFTK